MNNFISAQSLIHGFSLVLATVLGGFISYGVAKKDKFLLSGLPDYLFISFIFAVIGARLFYFISYRNDFFGFCDIFKIWQGGLVSYGGFIFGGIALFLLLHQSKKNVLKWLDYLSLGFAAGLFVGRIGDVLSGEYMGWIKFLNISLPVTFFEAYLGLIIFFLIYYLNNSKYQAVKIDGIKFSLVLLFYAGGRILIDFYRYEPKLLFSLSLGQLLGLIVLSCSVVFAIFLLLLGRRRTNGLR